MNRSIGQGELFNREDFHKIPISLENELTFSKDLIKTWQKRIHTYQEPHFKKAEKSPVHASFFESNNKKAFIPTPNPQELVPLALNFWRWPQNPHHGPAIYLVMDKPKDLEFHLLLYIGETVASEKRWKGEHDCKKYLQAYSEACTKAGLTTQLSIRFWKDVPHETICRRNLEQQLIQKWLPAFNKETRGFWNTPFTNHVP